MFFFVIGLLLNIHNLKHAITSYIHKEIYTCSIISAVHQELLHNNLLLTPTPTKWNVLPTRKICYLIANFFPCISFLSGDVFFFFSIGYFRPSSPDKRMQVSRKLLQNIMKTHIYVHIHKQFCFKFSYFTNSN